MFLEDAWRAAVAVVQEWSQLSPEDKRKIMELRHREKCCGCCRVKKIVEVGK